jgi:hypothetical protein
MLLARVFAERSPVGKGIHEQTVTASRVFDCDIRERITSTPKPTRKQVAS